LEAAGFRYKLGADVSQERPPMFKGQQVHQQRSVGRGERSQQTMQAQRSIPTMGGDAGERGEIRKLSF